MSEVIITNKCTNPDAIWGVSGVNDPIATGQSTSAFDAQGSVTIALQSGSNPSGLYYYTIPVPFTLTNNQFTIPLPSGDSSGPINVSIGDGQGKS